MNATQCQCHLESVKDLKNPLFRLVCHCLTCQAFVNGPYNDECTFLRRDCPEIKLERIEFKRYAPFSVIERGICKHCGKASICQAKIGSLVQLIMIPSHWLPPSNLPEAMAHVYAHRCVAEVNDTRPKIYGHLRSQGVILGAVLSHLFKRTWKK